MPKNKIKIVDATIRDGGLCNNFRFNDEFVRALYKANVLSGIDYMEFGYKASRKLFDEQLYGKWKFCRDDDIRNIVGNEKDKNKIKVSVMADVGRTDYKEDILNKKDSPIDLIRIATYIDTISEAVNIIEDGAKKGYETSVNIMAISRADINELSEILEILGKSPVDIFYIVDSYGAFYPDNMKNMVDLYCEKADKYNKFVGVHTHNNQQLAFSNTIEAFINGVKYLDATVNGLGRGAGNCAMELLLGYINEPKYKIEPIIEIIEKYIFDLKKRGIKWGYDIPYMFTGQYNLHPCSAIDFTNDNRNDYLNFILDLKD